MNFNKSSSFYSKRRFRLSPSFYNVCVPSVQRVLLLPLFLSFCLSVCLSVPRSFALDRVHSPQQPNRNATLVSLAACKELQAATTKNSLGKPGKAGSSSAGFLPSPSKRGCVDTVAPPPPSADHTPVLGSLVAPHGLLLDVHEVTVHARPAGERCHNAVRVPTLPELLLPE